MKLLIDECLHTSLVELAHAAGHAADHVNYLALGGYKDWQLMAIVREQEYTFVTNNRVDFLRLHANKPLHAGAIVIVPNVPPADQRALFSAALKHVGTRDLTTLSLRFDIQAIGLPVSSTFYRKVANEA